MKRFVGSYAHHYRAFRPPLHYLILKNCLGKRKFKKTLDIGCGVGNSNIALTNFSKKVIGYDINKEMLKIFYNTKEFLIQTNGQISNMIYYVFLDHYIISSKSKYIIF